MSLLAEIPLVDHLSTTKTTQTVPIMEMASAAVVMCSLSLIGVWQRGRYGPHILTRRV